MPVYSISTTQIQSIRISITILVNFPSLIEGLNMSFSFFFFFNFHETQLADHDEIGSCPRKNANKREQMTCSRDLSRRIVHSHYYVFGSVIKINPK